MKQNKQWSLKKVAEAHGYFSESNESESSRHHEGFNDFLGTKNNPKVLDIGCGNARILDSISHHSKYLGIDICEDLISSCNKNFKNDNKSSFLAMDIEKYRWPKEIKEYNIVYLDSTFTMMENPDMLFKRLAKTFKTIFFNRTQLYKFGEDSFSAKDSLIASDTEMIKSCHFWAGMNKSSPLWMFSSLYFNKFCDSYGGECSFYPGDIIIYERNSK
tara:strand:+ start:27269 stop:27916 length:648 start_codon:yes stop_codon:yes gene_type:complete